METNYTPIANRFRRELATLIAQRKSVPIDYTTELRELLSTTAIIKELYTNDQAEYASLSNGEAIRLDRIVRANGIVAPGYEGYDFGNSCAL